MRRLLLALFFLSCAGTVVLAQGPPLNATPEQLFDAGMNAFTGEDNTRDNAVAREYFRRSADQGYAPAQVVLGFLYDTATTVPASPHDAASWYRKAADGGDSLAQWLLGRLYLNGALPQDDFAAEKWLTPPASQDNPFAAYLLGRLMLTRDYTKAPRWLRIAAEQGLTQAQYLYAKALAEGRGVARSSLPGLRLVSRRSRFRLSRQQRPELSQCLLVPRSDRSGKSESAQSGGFGYALRRSPRVHRMERRIRRHPHSPTSPKTTLLPLVAFNALCDSRMVAN